MKKFEMKTFFGTYKDCYFVVEKYAHDNTLALEVWNDEEGPITMLTTCLPNGIAGKDEVYLDTNNNPQAEELLIKLNIGTDTGISTTSGYCIYPLYEINTKELKKYTL